MTRFRTITAALAVAALVCAGTALGAASTVARTLAFAGSYAGTAVVKVDGDNVAYSAAGKGTGTLIGASKIAGKGKGDASSQVCAVWLGTGTITAANGTKLNIAVMPGAKGCPNKSNQNIIALNGLLKVSGGTGKFAKAKGSLKFTGTLDRGKGVWSIKLTGTLSL